MKTSISLTVVMGITWIIGVLVVEVEELFALAFIFTIFVAFQGLSIFIFFVLLQKPLRDSYAKWWKAKVAESDFLSKHFGENTLTSSALVNLKLSDIFLLFSGTFSVQTTQCSAPPQKTGVAVGEKFELSQEIIKNSYIEDGPVDDEEKEIHHFGIKNAMFVKRPNSRSVADQENGYDKKGKNLMRY